MKIEKSFVVPWRIFKMLYNSSGRFRRGTGKFGYYLTTGVGFKVYLWIRI